MNAKATLEVAQELGVPESQLHQAVRKGDVPRPEKVGGVYVWIGKDIESARRFFRQKKNGAA